MNTRINKWRLWSGIISVALGVFGYFYLVTLCMAGAIPIDLSAVEDLNALMQSLSSGTADESFVLLGCSGTVTEMLFIAGIVSIITRNKRWFWNIPVALIMGYGMFYGFLGFKVMYPWCIWAAVCLFMSIVAMRTCYRAEHAPQEEPAEEQPENAPSPGMGAWQRPQQPAEPAAPVWQPQTKQPAAPEPAPEPVRPAEAPEPEYTMPPQARPIEDDE